MITKTFNIIKAFFAWWFSGLRYLIPETVRQAFRSSKNNLHADVTKNSIQLSADDTNQSSLLSLHNESTLANIKKWFADHKFKNTEITLNLDPGLLLIKSLTFPQAANDNLKNIISFEIDRHTPFAKDDVYFDYIVTSTDTGAKSISTDLYVIQKTKLDPVIALLDSANIHTKSFSIKNNSTRHLINLVPANNLSSNIDHTHALNFVLGLAVFILVTVLIITPAFKSSIIANELAAQTHELRSDATEVIKIRTELDDLIKKRSYVHKLKKSYPSVITLLSDITNLLPDDTWLHRFEINNNSVRFQGESNNASRLIELIESSSKFSEARFMSPLTQNPVSGHERFYITTKLTQQSKDDDAI